MQHLLCIETGTTTCSVALSRNLELIDALESHDPNHNHAKTLAPFINSLLEKNGLSANDLSAVVVSKGPGSYTGLRIGVSTAKGICFATNKPLIAVGSLESMAYGAIDWLKKNPDFPTPDYLCPLIDARRLEVYTQLFNLNPSSVSEIEAKILDENSFDNFLDKKRILFFGSGSAKAKKLIVSNSALFIEGFLPSARFMIPLALNHLKNKNYEDVAYFEPFYLKNFVAVKSSKNVFGS